MYSYDSYGWLSAQEIPGRTTTVDPPAHGDKVVGELYPNYTGIEWVLVAYSEPVISTPENPRIAEIKAELAAIDAKSDSPRARREALLGNTAWLSSLDTQAAALRAELATL
jgi:hypothetical protein